MIEKSDDADVKIRMTQSQYGSRKRFICGYRSVVPDTLTA